jgi:hypothetical protein
VIDNLRIEVKWGGGQGDCQGTADESPELPFGPFLPLGQGCSSYPQNPLFDIDCVRVVIGSLEFWCMGSTVLVGLVS